jgi:SagB-type dehydrogenase family enzyme
MKKVIWGTVMAALVFGAAAYSENKVKLPEPLLKGGMELNQVLKTRRSIRSYKEEPLSLDELSQLVWSAQGITDPKTGHRAAPSAVARYPLKLYAVVKPGGVSGLKPGVYLYEPKDHSLSLTKEGDLYPEVLKANAFFNKWIENTDVVFVVGGVPGILQKTMPESGAKFMALEAGMAAENLMLTAVSLGLGCCPVGGFKDEKIAATLGMDKDTEALLLVPVGKREAQSSQ